MTYPVEREKFQALMESEGMEREISRRILRWANTYQRLAVIDCNGDRRPRVPCPQDSVNGYGACACQLTGHGVHVLGAPVIGGGNYRHGDVPPVIIEQLRAQRIIREWCAKANTNATCPRHDMTTPYPVRCQGCDCSRREFAPIFSGDPRGACVKLRVPSGKTDDWGQTGIVVPTRRY